MSGIRFIAGMFLAQFLMAQVHVVPPFTPTKSNVSVLPKVPPPSLATDLAGPVPLLLEKLTVLEAKQYSGSNEKRIGVKRALPSNTMLFGRWSKPAGPGAPIWMLEISDRGAVGLRVHIVDYDGHGGRLWIHNGSRSAPQIAGLLRTAACSRTGISGPKLYSGTGS